ncbi:MAG: hypothetical protein JXA21_10010 [Anaerolineae bacterium]|nr:hypothetical protein [Anaerolineae bacterium]
MGFFQNHVTVRVCDSETDLAVFKNNTWKDDRVQRKPTQGTYLQVNSDAVEYEGEYTVQGAALKLTGDEVWQGTLRA